MSRATRTRATRTLVVLALAALCLGALGGTALGGKKRTTTVVFNSGSPELSGAKKVKANGSLKSSTACLSVRGMKLFLTDATGAVLATLDSSSSDANGNWKLQGNLPSSTPATGPVYVQVKATKRTVGKSVCKAGLSAVIQIRA